MGRKNVLKMKHSADVESYAVTLALCNGEISNLGS